MGEGGLAKGVAHKIHSSTRPEYRPSAGDANGEGGLASPMGVALRDLEETVDAGVGVSGEVGAAHKVRSVTLVRCKSQYNVRHSGCGEVLRLHARLIT